MVSIAAACILRRAGAAGTQLYSWSFRPGRARSWTAGRGRLGQRQRLALGLGSRLRAPLLAAELVAVAVARTCPALISLSALFARLRIALTLALCSSGGLWRFGSLLAILAELFNRTRQILERLLGLLATLFQCIRLASELIG